MDLKNNYRKFKAHLKAGGLSYALWRGIKYFCFLTQATRDRLLQLPETTIFQENIKVIGSGKGIHIYWNNTEITQGAGLHTAVNASGVWAHSIDARWKLLEKQRNNLKIRISHENLPIEQFWTIQIEDHRQISWQIRLKIKKPLHIDEISIGCSVNPRYKTWFNNYQQKDFSRLHAQWNDVYLDDISTSFLGVRFPVEGEFLPSMGFEFSDKSLIPVVRNAPLKDNFHDIGVRFTQFHARETCGRGIYPIVSGRIFLFEEDSLLDAKIEKLRKDSLDTAIKEAPSKKIKCNLKILLANLPWQRNGRWGVRAGSRWPHIRLENERDYLPFPFFLAYAASLLRKNGIEAALIDAIAEEIPEDKFFKMISEKKFDYLVAETSIPSFFDDLKMLKMIAQKGIPVILCGPNHEIYNHQFLKDHPFISFVLYGEYEFSLLELTESLQEGRDLSKVKGIIYRDQETVGKNVPRPPCDVNGLSWPLREGLPLHKYLDAPGEMRTPSVQMLASRGCPFECQFCLWPQVVYQGHHYRARNVKDVIDEMEYLVREKKFRSVYFDDDTFNIGRERMLQFCQEIRRRGLHKTPWAIMARPDLMDPELLDSFKKAGLYSIKYGVESASQSLVDSIAKNMDLKTAEKMIRLTKKMGIKVHLTFTFGLPGETWQTINETIEWAKSLDPFSAQFSITTPFPGTAYYKALEQKGFIASKDFSCYDGHSKSVIRSESLGPNDLEMARLYAHKAWAEHLRKRRGLSGNIKKFYDYAKTKGLGYATTKAVSYFKYTAKETRKDPNRAAKDQNSPPADILLIQCPPWDVSMPPLGIAYVSANLKKHGYAVSVRDLNIGLYNLAKAEEKYLWEQKSFSWWVEENLFETTWLHLKKNTHDLTEKILSDVDAKCIGLSVSFTSINFTKELLRLIKDKNKEIKIIIGGWSTCDEYMRSLFPGGLVDAFIVGEGEEVLPEALEALSNHSHGIIPGVIFTKENPALFKPREPVKNLNNIPWPTFSEFRLEEYRYPILPLFTSRGCIGHCSFCNDWPFSEPYRFRSAQNIFEEIEYHVKNNHTTVFSFKDLLCNGNISELDSLADLIINSKFKITWDSQAIARKEMNYKFLCKLKKSGCGSLIYGAESFSNNILKRMGKLFTKEILETVLRDTYGAGIAALINIIVGYPGETEDDFQETLGALQRNRKYIAQIGAISVCLINGNSLLDLNAEHHSVRLSPDQKIRAKKWVSLDGKNTYEDRKKRAEKVIDLIKRLGLSYDTATL